MREPMLVFHARDTRTYEPLPGLTGLATQDASLPNRRFVSCIIAASGEALSQWDPDSKASVQGTNDEATKPPRRMR